MMIAQTKSTSSSRSWPWERSRRPCPGVNAVAHHKNTSDQHVRDAFRVLMRRDIGGLVCHALWIEERQVGPIAFFHQPAVPETQLLCRKTGHLPERLLQGKHLLLPDIVPQDPWEGPIVAG